MSKGNWDVGVYATRVADAKKSGRSTFDYTDDMLRHVSRDRWTVHELLDPKRLNTLGMNVREALDTDEHPATTPIAIIFDVTGSMSGIPRVLQQKLPQLHGLLQRKGYVEDPQIMFGAVGDAYSDRVPLQIGQFESDNRMDETLGNIVLEGGGGGGNHESYQLAAYYLARHVSLDCLKRGKKGYLFFIGDERVYAKIDRRQVEELIGDKLEEHLTTEQIFAELKTKFEVFFLFAAQASYSPGQVLDNSAGSGGSWGYSDSNTAVCYWRDLLGQNALILEDASAVCETIALTLGLMEGTVSLDEGLDDLKAVGADLKAVKAAGKALATVGATTASVAKVNGTLSTTGVSGTSRL